MIHNQCFKSPRHTFLCGPTCILISLRIVSPQMVVINYQNNTKGPRWFKTSQSQLKGSRHRNVYSDQDIWKDVMDTPYQVYAYARRQVTQDYDDKRSYATCCRVVGLTHDTHHAPLWRYQQQTRYRGRMTNEWDGVPYQRNGYPQPYEQCDARCTTKRRGNGPTSYKVESKSPL
jgi:hypothetical protein